LAAAGETRCAFIPVRFQAKLSLTAALNLIHDQSTGEEARLLVLLDKSEQLKSLVERSRRHEVEYLN
jgi:hypothetical protein